jgi:hypothetical protein
MRSNNAKRLISAITLCAFIGCATHQQTPEEPPLPTSAQAGDTTVVAIAAPAAHCKTTLPDFLGITGLFKAIACGCDRLRNRLGMRFPGLEGKPPVLAITDPANMDPNAPPSVQAAAEVKSKEDAAEQKVKAIRYLATVGCTECYPDVETGLLEATRDCTEVVRYEAVKALREVAGSPCNACRHNSCCSPDIVRRLHELAYETDENCCFVEYSARVRRVARLALNACGGDTVYYVDTPAEGPAEAPAVEGGEGPPEETSTAGWLPGEASSMFAQGAAAGQPPVGGYGSQYSSTPIADPDLIAARVNGEPILLSEVLSRVDVRLAAVASTTSPQERQRLRQQWLSAELQRAIDTLLLCQEARRTMPPNEIAHVVHYEPLNAPAGQRPLPASDTVHDMLAESERLAAEWAKRCVDCPTDCTRQDVFAFYRTHLEQYRHPAQIRWERLGVRFDRVSCRAEAWDIITHLRAQIQGAPPSAGPNHNLQAVDVQAFEWTRYGELPQGPVGRTLATLPTGVVSTVLEDADGMYLVRVLERRDPTTPALDEIEVRVRDDLLHDRHASALEAHVHHLRQQAEVWTIFDSARL